MQEHDLGDFQSSQRPEREGKLKSGEVKTRQAAQVLLEANAPLPVWHETHVDYHLQSQVDYPIKLPSNLLKPLVEQAISAQLAERAANVPEAKRPSFIEGLRNLFKGKQDKLAEEVEQILSGEQGAVLEPNQSAGGELSDQLIDRIMQLIEDTVWEIGDRAIETIGSDEFISRQEHLWQEVRRERPSGSKVIEYDDFTDERYPLAAVMADAVLADARYFHDADTIVYFEFTVAPTIDKGRQRGEVGNTLYQGALTTAAKGQEIKPKVITHMVTDAHGSDRSNYALTKDSETGALLVAEPLVSANGTPMEYFVTHARLVVTRTPVDRTSTAAGGVY